MYLCLYTNYYSVWVVVMSASNIMNKRKPESIERFLENQAFLRLYDSAPRPPPSPISKLSLFLSQSFCMSPVELTLWGGGGGGHGAKSNDREKAWSSINHSMLSEATCIQGGRKEIHPPPPTAILIWARLCCRSCMMPLARPNTGPSFVIAQVKEWHWMCC